MIYFLRIFTLILIPFFLTSCEDDEVKSFSWVNFTYVENDLDEDIIVTTFVTSHFLMEDEDLPYAIIDTIKNKTEEQTYAWGYTASPEGAIDGWDEFELEDAFDSLIISDVLNTKIIYFSDFTNVEDWISSSRNEDGLKKFTLIVR